MPITHQIDDVKPLPGEAPASFDRLHNKPPLDEVIPLEFKEALLADEPDFMVVLDANVDAANRAYATDDTSLGKCGDLVKRYRALLSHVDATHKAVKAPYLQGGRLVDAERNTLAERIEAAKRQVENKANAFVAQRAAEQRAEQVRIAAEQRAAAEAAAQAERDRQAAEEANQRAIRDAANEEDRKAAQERADQARRDAEEAAAKAALAPAAQTKAEPVRSDEGATVSGKTEWACEVEDFKVAFRAVADDPKVREAIEAAVKRLVRAGKREIKGCNIYPTSKANFR
jgi:hypothetical protein